MSATSSSLDADQRVMERLPAWERRQHTGGHLLGEYHKWSCLLLVLFLCTVDLMRVLKQICGLCVRVGLLTLMSQDLLS